MLILHSKNPLPPEEDFLFVNLWYENLRFIHHQKILENVFLCGSHHRNDYYGD